jgi:hypothetical protein|tara:strand:- start:23102 stop:24034 length:933 start_codon:yes stop_codon:yes gene_type:complete
MKKVLIGLVVVVVLLVVLVVGGVIFGLTQIDKIVKTGIERGGTYATGVDTTVDMVDVSLTKGTFDMGGFQLANPAGFDTPHFLALSDTSVALNANQTGSQVITLSSLTLDGIDVYLDKGGNPSNYNTVLNNLKRFESGEKGPPPAESDGMKVVIDSLVIENIDVHLANMPGIGFVAGDVAVNVPRIELKNVGKDEPMGFAEVIGLVVKTVLAASVEAGGGIIPGDVLGDLSGGLAGLTSFSDMGIEAVGDLGKQLNEQLGGAVEQAQKALDDAKKAGEDLQNQADDLQDSVNDAADKVKGIFGGGKKDEP